MKGTGPVRQRGWKDQDRAVMAICMSCRWVPFFAAGAILTLNGCAPSPRLEVGHRGTAPQPAGFALTVDETIPDEFEAEIKEGLANQGFTPSRQPSYQLQLSLSEAPGKMGLVAPEREGHAKASWAMSPSRSRSTRTFRATLSLTDAASGRELFHAHVNVRARKEQPGIDEHLADALAAQLRGTREPQF